MKRKFETGHKIVLTLLSAIMLWGCGNETVADDAPEIRLATAIRMEESSSRSFPFISAPYNETLLSFRVSGKMEDFDVNPGDRFRLGDVIASLDKTDYNVAMQQAEASFVQAESEYNRINKLYSQGNISGSVYDKAKAAYMISRAAYESAANNLEYTELKAPFNGYIQSVYAEPWQEVGKGEGIVSLIDLDRLKICTYIPEDLAASLTRNGKVNPEDFEISFESIPGKIFYPSKVEISRSASNNNLSFLVTATLENKGNELFGGMSGKIEIKAGQMRNKYAAVPQHLVCHNERIGDFVWKYDEIAGKVSARPVKISTVKNGMAIVTEGIEEGDKISSSKLNMLTDGLEVKIIM